jgi:hypothetical protein
MYLDNDELSEHTIPETLGPNTDDPLLPMMLGNLWARALNLDPIIEKETPLRK